MAALAFPFFDLRFHPVSSWTFLQPEDKSRVADWKRAEALWDVFDGLPTRKRLILRAHVQSGEEEGSGAASKPSRANVCRHHGHREEQPDVLRMPQRAELVG